MSDKRVQVVIHGRVQGVGFRASCQQQAAALGVAGWVRNRWDGAVEAFLEGPEDAVDVMLRWCRRGPPAADVTSVEISDAPLTAPDAAAHRSFHIRG
jgi:acylphosphatase